MFEDLALTDERAYVGGSRTIPDRPEEPNKLTGVVLATETAVGAAERIASLLGDFLERCDGPAPEPATSASNGPERIRAGGHIGALDVRLTRLLEVLKTAEYRAGRLQRIG